ncbi:sodium/hydrogen exchanger 9B2 isoform X3 [Nematostella vectensis]|uniref:sodium/hydrogen exchanger 9B2 isoform X3 n=1 Tax=Nematostella vectensis TaxID=45351 RepID=UPI00207796B8|nr:sodium/hydrogen exchanger 9B2 isoform X3 [Nematostella vectensis]
MKGQNTETLELKVTENNGETQNSENSKSDNGFQMMLSGLGFTRPPSGFLSQALTRCLIVLVSYGVLWSITGHEMLPGGNLFGIFIILMCAAFGGFITTRVSCGVLPSLLGMLIVGFLLRNVPGIDVAKHIDKKWSATLRSIALVVILARSGLELDPGALRRLKFTCVRLAFGPCITEAVTVAVVVRYVLDMPWLWGFQLGFVLGAVSPAVVVPQLLVLQAKGYGVEQGIPTLVMAASSCDDVLAISLFGVFVGIAFSKGNLYFNIFRGPIELIMGIVIGILVGVVCWYLPNNQETNRLGNRFVLLAAFALLSVFGCNAAEFSGAGALGVLSMATIAGHGWGDDEKAAVSRAMAVLWEFFQPLLFGLIGAEVTWEYMDVSLVGRCIGALCISLLVRMMITGVLMAGNNLTLKEKVFVAIAWLPKATVQAAIGSMSLDIARERGYTGKFQEDLGVQIVTMAVLSILITAPIGAVAIAVSGPRLMRQAQPGHDSQEPQWNKTNVLLCTQSTPV